MRCCLWLKKHCVAPVAMTGVNGKSETTSCELPAPRVAVPVGSAARCVSLPAFCRLIATTQIGKVALLPAVSCAPTSLGSILARSGVMWSSSSVSPLTTVAARWRA